jgi:HEAT repeat protein
VLVVLVGVFSIQCVQDTPERIGTIYELKADPTEENLAKIRKSLEDPDRDVRATALNALVTLRVRDAREIARNFIDDDDDFVRATAAKLVGDLKNPADTPLLIERLLEDPDNVVRQRAAEALAKIGTEAAIEGLAQGLDDPMENVRLASVRGIRKVDPAFAKASLTRLLLQDSMWEIRVQAAGALGLTCDPTIEPALQAALEDPNEFVRGAAANALRVLEACQESARSEAESNT